MNPYKKLGNNDPFGVANQFNLPFCLAEAMKKLLCGGISGRKKSAEQDYREAIFSIERGITDISKYFLQKTATVERIHATMKLYAEVFPDANTYAHEAAKHILFFSRSGCIEHLKNSLRFAKMAVELESSKTGELCD